MPWTYFLNITNATDRKLKVLSSKLNWGDWYRDGVDDRGPTSVDPGQTVQALGIRAARGTWTGYEGSATWTDDVPQGQSSYGSVTNSVDVPFSGSNSSSCTPSGAYTISGWSPLPSSGSSFERSITISVGPKGALKATSASAAETSTDDVDDDYAVFLLQSARNPDVRDWNAVKTGLTEIDGFPITDYIPKSVDIVSRFLARSPVLDIEPARWPGVGDPDCPTPYAQTLFVKRYFAVAIYSVGTNPREIFSLVRGETRTFKKRVETTSVIRNVLTTSLSIKQSLTEKASIPEIGAELGSTLDTEFSVQNVLEISRQTVSEEVQEVTFKAPDDFDLQIVPWVFSTAVVIYREDKKGKISLVAASDWAQAQIYSSYKTSP